MAAGGRRPGSPDMLAHAMRAFRLQGEECMIATVNLLARPGPDGCWGVAAARAEQRRAKEARIPLHRFTAPEEVAKAVLCLASPAANFISGVSLPLDGGMQVGP
jgi:NAD(P)-dependent dehydrogenase (short-subunit alcohol dehydrogenase family)